MKVKLDTIVGGLEIVSDTFDVYFNPKTNEIDFIDLFSNPSFYTDEEDSIPEDAIFLPSQFEIHEYSIMENFIYTIEDEEIYGELLFAIRGRGAFRNFKHQIHRFGIQDDWYGFKEEKFIRIAKGWCDQHNIPYEE